MIRSAQTFLRIALALAMTLLSLLPSSAQAGRTGGGMGSGSRSSASRSSSAPRTTYRSTPAPRPPAPTRSSPAPRTTAPRAATTSSAPRRSTTFTTTTPRARTQTYHAPIVVVTHPYTQPAQTQTIQTQTVQQTDADVHTDRIITATGGNDFSSTANLLKLLLWIAGAALLLYLLWRVVQSRSYRATALVGQGTTLPDTSDALLAPQPHPNAQAVSVQLLLTHGESVKTALQEIARTADPDSQAGLVRMVGDVALLTLRSQPDWTHGQVRVVSGSEDGMDAECGRVSILARSAFEQQTTSNYRGAGPGAVHRTPDNAGSERPAGGQFLALTIAVALRGVAATETQPQALLLRLSNLSEQELIRAEIVWSPDQEGELLNEDDAIRLYPTLTPL